MTPLNFCYWLQGHFEMSVNKGLTYEQITMIKEHLASVFEAENQHKFIGRGLSETLQDGSVSGNRQLSGHGTLLSPFTVTCNTGKA